MKLFIRNESCLDTLSNKVHSKPKLICLYRSIMPRAKTRDSFNQRLLVESTAMLATV